MLLLCFSFKFAVLLFLYNIKAGFGKDFDVVGPAFTNEPQNRVEFSNNTGTKVVCSAEGNPKPSISWTLSDGNRVGHVPGLRQVMTDGTLVFLPFSSENYRQDVHSAMYNCMATNMAGSIISRGVNVNAVMSQPYEPQVYDAFPLKGNAAVLKCHLPNFIGTHIVVSAWIKDNVLKITSSTKSNGKYFMARPEELVIFDVGHDDSGSTFRCQTTDRLTGENKLSSTAGKLFVSEPKSTVSPRIIDGTVSAFCSEGEKLILPCIAQGFPIPTVSWYTKSSNGQLLSLLTSERVMKTGLFIVISNAQFSDAKTYLCIAENNVGSERKEINVTVTVPLSVQVSPHHLKLNGNSQLRCLVKGSPVLTIEWMKNGRLIPFNNMSEFIHIEESGMYQCFAKNDRETVHDTVEVKAGDRLPKITATFGEKIVRQGEDITLQCNVTGNPLPEGKWYLDGDLLKEGKKITITQSQSGENEVNNLNLQIFGMATEDGGVYECVFENAIGEARYMNRISVYGKPGIRPMKNVLGIAGRSLYINCPYYGYPIIKMKWTKDEVELPTDPRHFVYENGSLSIRKLQKEMDNGKYKCEIDDFETSASQEVAVEVLIPPKIMPFSYQEELLREGMRARLQCVVSEGDSPITIEWLKDNVNLPQELGINVRHLDEFSSILTIASVNPRLNGMYTCKATNPAATVTHTAKLNVNGKPLNNEFSFSAPPKVIPFAFLDDQFYEGMRAHLTCAVSQGDPPLSFQWSKNGRPVTEPSVMTREYDKYTSSLSIQSVSSVHAGNYTCTVSNRAASVKHTAQLLVHVAPKIIPFSFRDKFVSNGNQARVLCGLAEGDGSIAISWLKDGHPVTDEGVVIRSVDNYSSILSIASVTQAHTGNYTCVAHSYAASSKFTAELVVNGKIILCCNVFSAAPKIIPFSFQDDLFEGVLARISCVVYQGDLPISINWFKDGHPLPLASQQGLNIRKIDEFSSSLTVDSVRQEHSGNYTCVAENNAASTNSTATLNVNGNESGMTYFHNFYSPSKDCPIHISRRAFTGRDVSPSFLCNKSRRFTLKHHVVKRWSTNSVSTICCHSRF